MRSGEQDLFGFPARRSGCFNWSLSLRWSE